MTFNLIIFHASMKLYDAPSEWGSYGVFIALPFTAAEGILTTTIFIEVNVD
ncbi:MULTISPECIES: hypothetical protein [unclassified Niallia]|uniref:hypothetical protein n=1 Tax=unclassified Niallia TaxID=2837522 RepID=UPI0030FCF34E